MINRYVILLFMGFSIMINSAQDIALSFSDMVSSKGLSPVNCVVSSDKYFYIQQREKSKKCDLTINIFNDKLKKEASFSLDNPKYEFISIKYFFDKVILFASYNEQMHTHLVYSILDDKLGFGPFNEIFKEPQKSGYPTSFIISDKTYEDQLHVIAELPYVSGKNEDIKLLIFDKNLKLAKEVYNKLEVKFETKRDNKLIISPNGKIFLIKTYWEKGNNFNIYSLGREVIKEEVIKLNRNKISALDYFFNAKNELVIAGFYSSQIRYNYEGYFLFKYDDDLTLVHKNQYHFNEKIIKTFKSAKEIKEKGFGLDKFLLTSFKMDAKGNHYLVAEHLGRKKVKEINNWHSMGMVIIKFNRNGNFVWGCPIEREQVHLKRIFIGGFALSNFQEPQYFYNELANLNLRKGIPVEYGVNNYCGTKHITFDEVGIPTTKDLTISFPGSDMLAFHPVEINSNTNTKTIFQVINESGEKSCLAVIE